MNKKIRPYQLFLIACFAVLGAILFFVFSRTTKPSAPIARDRSGSVAHSSNVAQGASLDESSIERLASAASKRVAGDQAQLRDAIADTLLVYTGGTVDDWLAYLRGYGIEPPPVAMSNPALVAGRWEQVRAFFDEAEFRPDEAEIALNPPKRELTERQKMGIGEPEDVGKLHATARRDDARQFLRHAQYDSLDRVRVTIPGRFRMLSPLGVPTAERADGVLMLEWTFDPESELWILTEMEFEGRKADPSEPTSVPLLL